MAPGPVRDPVTGRILGAFFDVYNALGWGFLESVYRRALLVELRKLGAIAEEEAFLPVQYRGVRIGEFRADLIVDAAVIVEVKAVDALAQTHRAQLLNYLMATRIERGLLLNFGPNASFQRLILSNDRKRPVPL